MSISLYETAVYLALAASEMNGKKDVALAIENDPANPVIWGMGIDDSRGKSDSHSAVINLLQNRDSWRKNVGKGPKYFIAISNTPDIKSQGMARMVIFSDPPQIVFADKLGTNGISVLTWDKPKNIWEKSSVARVGGGPFNYPLVKSDDLKSEKRTQNAKDWFDLLDRNSASFNLTDKKLLTDFDDLHVDSNKLKFKSFPTLTFPLAPDMQARGGTRVVDSAARNQLFMNMAWAIVYAAFNSKNEDFVRNRFPGGHNIGSVLRGPEDEILGWGFNTGGLDSTFHGEVNLIQNFHLRNEGKEIPQGSILYTTLEPCHMCAAMYAEAGNNNLCFFGQGDGGIVNNALSGNGLNGNKQKPLKTSLGDEIEALYKNPPPRPVAPGKKKKRGSKPPKKLPAITTFLQNNETREVIQNALLNYKKLKPDRDTHEFEIWKAGNRIISTILFGN